MILAFPHPLTTDWTGMLALGADLHPDFLEIAYSFGIFPWFYPGQDPVWWFPNPRMVIFPSKLKVSKSMRSYFNQKKYSVTFDRSFREVMKHCKEVFRPDQNGSSWISDDLIDSYCQLHERGLAHSVEVWEDRKLVGGLYGVAIGKLFFGESMFSLKANASKFALITLVRTLEKKEFVLIDCQQESPHLASMGAVPIPAEEFYKTIKGNLLNYGYLKHKWDNWEVNPSDIIG